MGVTTAVATAAKAKVAAAVLAGVVVAGGGAAGATVAAANGAFGSQVAAKVTTCKQQLTSGVHGIGQCVSTFAKQKGVQERDQHSQNNGKGNNGKPAGTPGAHATPSGRPSMTPGAAGNHGAPPIETPGSSSGRP